MLDNWTIGKKIGLGFAALVALTMLISGIAVYALRTAVESKDRVISDFASKLIDAEKLRTAVMGKYAASRSFLLDADPEDVTTMARHRRDFAEAIDRIKPLLETAEGKELIQHVNDAERDHERALQDLIALRKGNTPQAEIAVLLDKNVAPKRAVLDRAVDDFVKLQTRLLDDSKKASTEAADAARLLVAIIAGITLLIGAGIAIALTRSLTGQISSAVQHIQGSAAELQAASNQQMAATKEQSAALNEVTATLKELVATSHQIAQSSQRVAKIAQDTSASAKSGDSTTQRAQNGMGAIKQQVDVIATHMLDLGKKSQQIGSVLEVINELSDQTNILAINASIEAAGAGEAGRRFSVVAAEIRNLADRVAASTKEIRALVDDVRAAVNAAVLATETGVKEVEAGRKQFSDVTGALKQILDMVVTTSEAAREIELSTTQQTTAVEQVSVAINDAAQGAKETETSTAQTLQTSGQLAKLSQELVRLISAQAA